MVVFLCLSKAKNQHIKKKKKEVPNLADSTASIGIWYKRGFGSLPRNLSLRKMHKKNMHEDHHHSNFGGDDKTEPLWRAFVCVQKCPICHSVEHCELDLREGEGEREPWLGQRFWDFNREACSWWWRWRGIASEMICQRDDGSL